MWIAAASARAMLDCVGWMKMLVGFDFERGRLKGPCWSGLGAVGEVAVGVVVSLASESDEAEESE